MKRNAYAKINLILDVLGKREDGYHDINFLMTIIDLYDEVVLEENTIGQDEIEVINSKEEYLHTLSNESNLAFKALKLMKEKYNINKFYKIKIIKNIPIAAGMAGGSTDAASILHLINDMENLGLSKKELATIGISLGSDIYFCIYSKLCIVKGKGDILEEISIVPPRSKVLVINPKKELSTKEVYDNYKIKTTSNESIESILKINDYNKFYSSLRNDLESTSKRLESTIEEIENFVYNCNVNVDKVMVSGSGPTVLVFADDSVLEDIMKQLVLRKEFEKYYINIHEILY